MKIFPHLRQALVMLGLTIGLAATSSAQQSPLTSIKFVTDWAFTGPQAMWAAADSDGCYGKQGLAVKTDRGFGSGDSIAKVASGSYQIGVADFGSVATYNAQHPDKPVIATFIISDRSSSAVAMLKKSGIRTPKDLIGKRVADRQGEAARVLFPAFARANGFTEHQINWVTVTENLRQAAVVRGQADAAAGHVFSLINGFRSLGVKLEDIVFIPFADHGVDIPGNMVIVRPDWLKANGEQMRKFLVCVSDGIKTSLDDPQRSVELLTHYNSVLDKSFELENLKFANKTAVATPAVKVNGLSSISTGRLDHALTLISQATGKSKLMPNQVYTDAYLPPMSVRRLDPAASK